MIWVLSNWLFITTLCLVWGSAGLSGAVRLFGLPKPRFVHPVLLMLVGMGVLTWLGNVLSLFVAIDQYVVIGITLFSCVLWYAELRRYGIYGRRYYRRWQKMHPWVYVLFSCILVIALIKAIGPTEVPDEGEYYLPLVRWIEQYAVVPGTALLHDRMGYNSAFHLSSALFGHAEWTGGGLYDLNALLFVWIHGYALAAVNRLLRRQYTLLWSDLLLVAGGVFLFRKLLTSFDADYPANFIGIIVLSLWLRKVSQGDRTFDATILIIGLLALFLTTVKLTAAFLLCLPAIILLINEHRDRLSVVLLSVALGFLYLSPWLLRNYYLTGYLIYPVYWLNVFDPEWKIPQEIARANYWYISEHAKTMVVRYTYGYSGTTLPTLAEWWPQWLRIMWQDVVGKVILLAFIPALIGNIGWWRRREEGKSGFLLRFTLFWLFVVILLWWWRIPAIRFGWSYLLTFLLLGGTFWALHILRMGTRMWSMIWVVILSLSFIRGGWLSITEGENIDRLLIRPEAIPDLDGFRTEKIGNTRIILADSVYCWGIDPPCVPTYYPINMILRGDRLDEGFILKKDTDK